MYESSRRADRDVKRGDDRMGRLVRNGRVFQVEFDGLPQHHQSLLHRVPFAGDVELYAPCDVATVFRVRLAVNVIVWAMSSVSLIGRANWTPGRHPPGPACGCRRRGTALPDGEWQPALLDRNRRVLKGSHDVHIFQDQGRS